MLVTAKVWDPGPRLSGVARPPDGHAALDAMTFKAAGRGEDMVARESPGRTERPSVFMNEYAVRGA